MKLQSHSPAKITESLCRRIIKLNFQVVEYFFPYLPVQDKQVYDVIIIRIIDFLSIRLLAPNTNQQIIHNPVERRESQATNERG